MRSRRCPPATSRWQPPAATAPDFPDASHVPDSWQLIRRRADGEEETLAKGALSFDLAPDGSVSWESPLQRLSEIAPGSDLSLRLPAGVPAPGRSSVTGVTNSSST